MGHGFGTGRVLEGIASGLDKPPLGLPRKEAKEDRAFALDQRDRLVEQQNIAKEFTAFQRTYKKALGSFITSNGLVHQPLTNTFNEHFGDGGTIELIRDPIKKTFTFRATDPSGKVSEKAGLSFEDVGKVATGALNPTLFFAAKTGKDGTAIVKPGDRLVSTETGKTIAEGGEVKPKPTQKTVKPGETVIDSEGKIIFRIPAKIEGQKVSPFNPQSYEAQIGREVARNMGGSLLPGGGWLIPEGQNERFTTLNEMAQLIGRQTGGKVPAGTLAGIVSRAGRQILSEEQAEEQAQQEVAEKTSVLGTDKAELGMPRAKFIEKRVGEIVQESINAAIEQVNPEVPEVMSRLPAVGGGQGLPAGPTPQPDIVAGQPVNPAPLPQAAPQAQGTRENPFRPGPTDEEFNAIPAGAIFIDPGDGKPYRKP
ncbi:hypothetical protein LCGC14_2478660 [marine sediment metagenome]|uniref:Uncharacterized protein n=1 Tax=marine sediment metagenome TaxID=412755 RepID=A0A0F9E1Z2_9ZZZZ